MACPYAMYPAYGHAMYPVYGHAMYPVYGHAMACPYKNNPSTDRYRSPVS